VWQSVNFQQQTEQQHITRSKHQKQQHSFPFAIEGAAAAINIAKRKMSDY